MEKPKEDYTDGLVQDCSNSIANTLELLQSCAKPSIQPQASTGSPLADDSDRPKIYSNHNFHFILL